jgi:phosphohistidine swiveling domain-containing protein
MALKFLLDRKGMYIYPWYISDITSTEDIGKITGGLVVKKSFIIIENDLFEFYYDIESSNRIGRYFLKKIIEDRKFFQKVINQIYRYSEELDQFRRRIDSKRKLGNLSNRDLRNIYSEYIRRLSILRAWGWVPVFIDGLEINFLTDAVTREFKKYLTHIGQKDKFGDYYSTLSSSEKMSEVQQEELARLKLLSKIFARRDSKKVIELIQKKDIELIEKKYPDVARDLTVHLRRFGWLTYAYSGPVMTIRHLFELLKDNIKAGSIEKQLESLRKHYVNVGKDKISIIKKVALPEKLQYLFRVSSELMFIKDYRKGTYQKSYVSMDRVLGEISKRLEISMKGVKHMILSEIVEALSNNKKAEKYRSIVNSRLKKCCYIAEQGRIQIFEGAECEKIIKCSIPSAGKMTFAKKQEQVQLKGMVAYKGKVTGIVKIVLTQEDVAKVKKGDILVSSATNPDLISAMKKAAAFVTDTGGITSHAAIISRELKKPCVVGTKNGTHVLEDGNIVEVDADNGIVRILNNN